jgi:hypothetical protein
LLENAGFVGDAGLGPRQCPRCEALNAYDALFCARCSMALVEAARKSGKYLQLLRL